jgi:hypothetical protein
MFAARTFRMSAAAVAAAVSVGILGAAPAQAGKPAPAPTGLAASVTAHQNGTYDIAASWNAVPSATSYRTTLTKGGVTLSSATVTTTSWTPTLTTSPGNASLSVRAVVGKRPGKTASISVPLPDVTPPTGAFTATWDDNTGIATIAITTPVADNSGGPVTASVDWNDGSLPQSWDLASDITHTYSLAAARYVPTVTLTDSSNNDNPVEVNAVVIDDTQAPTGAFSVSPGAAWAGFTSVTVSQDGALSDNWSPPANIARSVDWGDGTTEAWASGTTLSHLYATAGSYTPVVTIADEAHNANPVSTSEVLVTADTSAPTVKLTLPKAKHSVKAWKTLRGKATDAETGVKSVWLKAVEKRGAAWYGYNATTHTWVKAKSKAKAFGKAKAFTLTTNVQHQWSAKLAKLRKGTLVYKVRATDQVNNVSATVTHTARLTKR